MNKAKLFLNQARSLKKSIDFKREQIEVINSMAERTTTSFNAERTSGTSNRSKIEMAVEKLDEIKDALADDLNAFNKAYIEIEAVISKVDNATYRELLTYHYLCFMSWEDTAVKMNYSYVHLVHRLHPKALKSVEDVIECNI